MHTCVCLDLCVCVCMHAFMHVFMYTHLLYVRVYHHMHTNTHIRMYICKGSKKNLRFKTQSQLHTFITHTHTQKKKTQAASTTHVLKRSPNFIRSYNIQNTHTHTQTQAASTTHVLKRSTNFIRSYNIHTHTHTHTNAGSKYNTRFETQHQLHTFI